MQITAITLTVMLFIRFTGYAADNMPDLTKVDANTLKSHLGHVVSIRGRLEVGMQGACLIDATPAGVVFYVIPDVPPGGYTWPASLTQLIHHQVRVTGELKFCSFDHGLAKPGDQIPPDYYFMVLQSAEIQPFDSK